MDTETWNRASTLKSSEPIPDVDHDPDTKT